MFGFIFCENLPGVSPPSLASSNKFGTKPNYPTLNMFRNSEICEGIVGFTNWMCRTSCPYSAAAQTVAAPEELELDTTVAAVVAPITPVNAASVV